MDAAETGKAEKLQQMCRDSQSFFTWFFGLCDWDAYWKDSHPVICFTPNRHAWSSFQKCFIAFVIFCIVATCTGTMCMYLFTLIVLEDRVAEFLAGLAGITTAATGFALWFNSHILPLLKAYFGINDTPLNPPPNPSSNQLDRKRIKRVSLIGTI